MTLPNIKLKLVSPPNVQVKLLPRYPVRMQGDGGIVVTTANGIATVEPDVGDLNPVEVLENGTDLYFWSYSATMGYARFSAQAIVDFLGEEYQPLDADLTAIADLTGTGIARRTGADAWSVGTAIATAEIGDKQVTLAKIQDIATDRLLGRDTDGTGAPEEIEVGGGLEWTGTGGIQRSELSGDVNADAGSNSTTIANNAVSNAKLRDSAALSVIGRASNSSGDPADITAGADGAVLRRDGTTLGFGTVATAGLANNAVTYAKMQDISATQRVLGRNTAGAGDPEEVTAAQILEWLGSTRGSILLRGASGWTVLTPGTNGYVLTSNGAGADPSWQASTGGGGGTIAVYDNAIINGNFDHWIYATSQTTSGYGSDDRWYNANNGTTKTHQQQNFFAGQTDVPGNPKFWSRTIVTSSPGAGNYAFKMQRVKGVQTLSGQKATLTFYAKASAALPMAVSFRQNFGTGGSPSSQVIIPAGHVALSTSWQRFDVVVDLPSVSGKTLGSNGDDFLQVNFWFDAGSNFNDETDGLGQQSGTFDIARVSLKAGDLSSAPDPFLPYDELLDLLRCEHFCRIATVEFSGNTTDGTAYIAIQAIQPPMRAAPSATALSNNNNVAFSGNSTPITDARYIRGVLTAASAQNGGRFQTTFRLSAEL